MLKSAIHHKDGKNTIEVSEDAMMTTLENGSLRIIVMLSHNGHFKVIWEDMEHGIVLEERDGLFSKLTLEEALHIREKLKENGYDVETLSSDGHLILEDSERDAVLRMIKEEEENQK